VSTILWGWVRHGTVEAALSQQYEIVASATHAGNPAAMVEVAQMYRDGLGVSHDLILAHVCSKLTTQMGASVTYLDRKIAVCLCEAEMRQANAKVSALLQEDDLRDLVMHRQ
jgi:TPR repeat protein